LEEPVEFWHSQCIYICIHMSIYIYTLYIHILAYIYICMYVEHYTQNLGPREGDPSRGRWTYIYIYIINICIWDTDICQLINHKLIVNTVNSSQKSSETHISNRKSSTYMAQWQKLCGLIPTPGSTFIWVNHWLRPGSENIFGIGLWNLP
jgi:hypothetical protein